MSHKPGWDPDQLIMQNRMKTVGLVNTEAIELVHTPEANSLRLDTDYLRDALNAAEALGGDGQVWLTAEEDKPAVLTPTDRTDVSAIIAPLIGPNVENKPPTEEHDL